MAFRIDPARPLHDEFARLVGEATDAIAGHLQAASGDHARELHEARKMVKKLRALLRLARAAAPEPIKAAEHRFRDAARAIAGPREATAAVETLDRFIAAYPKRIVDCRLGEIRAALLRRRERIAEADLGEATQEALATCSEARDTLHAMAFDQAKSDEDILARGMKKTLKRWGRALEGAERHGRPEDFHELRKAVKAHWAQLGLLRDCLPGGPGKRRAKVKALGERLGDLNDIHVMRAALADGAFGIPGDIDTSGFDRLLKKKGKALSKKVVAKAGRLFDGWPKNSVRRLHIAIAEAA